jgi:hypothetical protein
VVKLSGDDRSGGPATWYVFETFVADGSLAIGMAQGEPNPAMAMIVQAGLTRAAAQEVAARLAREHRARGLPLPRVSHLDLLPDLGDV